MYVMCLNEANPVGNRLPLRVTDHFRMEFMSDDHNRTLADRTNVDFYALQFSHRILLRC